MRCKCKGSRAITGIQKCFGKGCEQQQRSRFRKRLIGSAAQLRSLLRKKERIASTMCAAIESSPGAVHCIRMAPNLTVFSDRGSIFESHCNVAPSWGPPSPTRYRHPRFRLLFYARRQTTHFAFGSRTLVAQHANLRSPNRNQWKIDYLYAGWTRRFFYVARPHAVRWPSTPASFRREGRIKYDKKNTD